MPAQAATSEEGQPSPGIMTDFLTLLFGLVRVYEAEGAILHFEKWKKKLEEHLEQEVILVIHWPVQTIGDFF